MMIGIDSVASWLRISRHASKPFIRGITTSIKMRSGCSATAFSTPLMPSSAVMTSQPRIERKMSCWVIAATFESSTTRIFFGRIHTPTASVRLVRRRPVGLRIGSLERIGRSKASLTKAGRSLRGAPRNRRGPDRKPGRCGPPSATPRQLDQRSDSSMDRIFRASSIFRNGL